MPPKTPRFVPPHDRDTELPRSTPRFRAPPSSTPSAASRRAAPSFITPSQTAPSASQQSSYSAPPRFLRPALPPSSSVTPARRDRPKFASTPGAHLSPEELDEDDVDHNSESPIRKKIRIAATVDDDTEDEDPPVVKGAVDKSGIEIESSPPTSNDEKRKSAAKYTARGPDIESDGDENDKDESPVVRRAQQEADIESMLSQHSASLSQASTTTAPDGSQGSEDDGFPTPSRPSRFTHFVTPVATDLASAQPSRTNLLSRLRAATPPSASIPSLQMLLMSPEKKRSSYVPGGFAATVANWIVGSRNAFESRQRRQDYLRVRVSEKLGKVVRGFRELYGADEGHGKEEKEEEVMAVLVGDVRVEMGDVVLIRWPWMEIDMPMRGRMRVAVFWSVERSGKDKTEQQQQQEDMDHALYDEEYRHDAGMGHHIEIDADNDSPEVERRYQSLEDVLGLSPSPVFPT